jgi:two-component system phosphate regulon sensor histidine kinase PhoR
MSKNRNPHQITYLASFLVALVSLFILIVAHLIFKPNFHIAYTSLIGLSIWIFSYFIFRHYIENYIYRKIKLIYKIIRRTKTSTKEKRIDILKDKDILEDVETEAEKFVRDREIEMESLRSLADYRRNYMGNISHELKTPIFNIQGYLHTLIDGALYDEKINKVYLQKAYKNVNRLLTIIEDLDVIHKLESGEKELAYEEFDIKELVLDVFDEMEMSASDKNIDLKFKPGADESFMVNADKEQIRQVFTNLITNAIKYSNENGFAKVSFYDMDKTILVEISDNGLGIDEKHLKYIFDRFYRVDESRSRDRGGSGIGLAIVKHIIEAHGQVISVRSTSGEGSTFGFSLKKA